ncbi:MAG: MFS transporter, partial [Pseudomonadota bacterium]
MSDTAELIARLDRIPVWPYRPRVLWVVGFGFFFAFFDIVTIGFALPLIEQQFGISDSLASWAVTASLLAYIVGSFVVSRIADHFGRRVALIISVVLFTGGSLLSATAGDIWWLIVWRVVSGMGIGAEIAVTSTYLGELSPAKLRGRFTSWAIFFGFLGFAVVPFVALAVVPNLDWGWRLLFVIGGCGGLVIGIMRRHLPVSIRWHAAHGEFETAVRHLEEAEEVAEKRLGGPLPPPEKVAHEPAAGGHGLGELLNPIYRRRLVLLALIWFFYYVGNYAWLTLAPTLLINEGYSLTRSIGFIAITSTGFVVGALAAVWLSDRMERKVLSG